MTKSLVKVKVFCFPFNEVSIPDIFVATLVVPYNKLLDAVIVGAVIVVPFLPVIFPEPIVPVVILLLDVNSPPLDEIVFPLMVMLSPANKVSCFPVNAVSILPIFVATLVVPYNKLLDAVIVGAVMVVPFLPVIFPELIVPVVILLLDVNSLPLEEIEFPLMVMLSPAVKVFCFPFNVVSILPIFVATLVVPYNKLLDALIVGAVMVAPFPPVIFPELIVPVVILLFEPNVFCFYLKLN